MIDLASMALSLALLCAAVIAFLATFLRASPLPDAWKRQRPLSCNLCMALWCGAPIVGALVVERMLARAPDLSWLLTIGSALASLGFATALMQLTGWTPPEPGPLVQDEAPLVQGQSLPHSKTSCGQCKHSFHGKARCYCGCTVDWKVEPAT